MDDDLNYLKFVNNFIPEDLKVAIRTLYEKEIPEAKLEQKCSCDKNPIEFNCQLCQKGLCHNCVIICSHKLMNICSDHEICCLCKKNCVCEQCRQYFSDDICNFCSDEVDYPYHCGCYRKRKGRCGICEHRMNYLGKET